MDSLRFLNKKVNANERQNFSNWWKEQISINGQEIVYYSNLTQLSSSNPLYGESPDAGFAPGVPMILALALSNDSILLSRMGLIAEGDVTAVIHPTLFENSLSSLSFHNLSADVVNAAAFSALTATSFICLSSSKLSATAFAFLSTTSLSADAINALGSPSLSSLTLSSITFDSLSSSAFFTLSSNAVSSLNISISALNLQTKEPKAGDLIALTEFGSDRIHFPKRGTTVYELTESIDEFKQNALGGHYVWFLAAKRYQFSQEPLSPGAGIGANVLDDNDIIEQTANENFSYITDNPNSNPSVYGHY